MRFVSHISSHILYHYENVKFGNYSPEIGNYLELITVITWMSVKSYLIFCNTTQAVMCELTQVSDVIQLAVPVSQLALSKPTFFIFMLSVLENSILCLSTLCVSI